MSTERIDILVAARNEARGVAKQVAGDFRALGSEMQNLSGSGSVFDSLASSVGGLGAVLAGGAIVAGIQKIGAAIFDLAEQSAKADRLRTSFGQLAAGVGESSDQMLAALRKASAGTVADTDLILQANRANLLGVAQSTDDLVKLLEIAGARGKATGRSLKDAFEDITLGIGRESKLILDNLGFMVDVEAVQSAYAASIGKTTDELSNLERKQAITNELFAQSKDLIDANKTSGGDLASSFERMDASIANAKEALGALFGPAVAVVAENLAKAAQGAAEQLDEIGKGFDVSSALGQMEGLRLVIAKMDEGLNRLEGDRGTPFANEPQRLELIADRRDAQDELNQVTDAYFDALRKLYPAEQQAFNPTSIEAQTAATRELAVARAEAAKAAQDAINSAPDFIGQSANRLIRTGDDDAAVQQRVVALKSDFQDIQKLQNSINNGISNGTAKLSDILGPERAFSVAADLLDEFDKKLKGLASQKLSGEIDTSEFLFQLQALPDQASAIFTQVQAAAKDGGAKLQEDLKSTINLRDAFALGGNDEAVSQLNDKISSIVQILGIVNPAAMAAADGFGAIGTAASKSDAMLGSIVTNANGAGTALESLGSSAVSADAQLASIVTNAGGAGSAIGDMGADTSNTANEIYALNAALAGAPPALAAAGSAMIAAGIDASTAASLVAGLTAEFNQLAGAQAGARRAIIQRAAGVADIVGPQKALALANQEIAKSEAAYKGLQDGLLAAGDGSTQFEFDLALLGTTTTSTFDEIEEADRKAKQLANQGLKSASAAANDAEKSFDSLKGKVAGVLSGALSLDVGVDTDKILGRPDAINEDARRLADVAVKGFDSPWATYLRDKFPELFGDAFVPGEDIKKKAAEALRAFEDGLVPELLDKEKAKERVRRALVGEQNMADLANEIATELSAEFGGSINLGKIQATANTALGVAGGETDQLAQTLTGAASGVQSQLAGLGGSVKSGILAALEGIGEAVTGALDKQFRSEGSLKTMREAGGINGEAWGSGFLSKVGDNVPPKLIELLSVLVTPGVEAILNRNQTLQGAN